MTFVAGAGPAAAQAWRGWEMLNMSQTLLWRDQRDFLLLWEGIKQRVMFVWLL